MGKHDLFDIVTVGHSNHPIEHFLGQLRVNSVACIADVRSKPFSRRFPWFSQPRLARHLEDAGIAYMACGDRLGGRPADPALYRAGVADYEAMAASAPFRAGLAAVLEAGRTQCLCLMCAEREPLDCHRCLLVARALARDGYRVGHILADTSIEPHARTEERLLAAMKFGGDLFAPSREQQLAEAYRRRAGAALGA